MLIPKAASDGTVSCRNPGDYPQLRIAGEKQFFTNHAGIGDRRCQGVEMGTDPQIGSLASANIPPS